jgi:uncharacterized membrane protein
MRCFACLSAVLCILTMVACDDPSVPASPPGEPSWRRLEGGVGESRFVGVWGTRVDSLVALGVDYPLLRRSGDTWWYESPPAGVAGLRGVWGRAADDVFAVGPGGTIIHFDGTAWSPMSSGVPTRLNDVWGVGADVFAVGGGNGASGGRLIHYDGNAWSSIPGGFTYGLNTVWALGPKSILVAGELGYVGRFDGRVWTTLNLQPYPYSWWDAWGSASNDVFFVGDGGRAAHLRNGEPQAAFVASATLRSVFGFGPDDVWAVGDDGVIVHYDGSAWSTVASGTTTPLRAVWGFADGRAVALGDGGLVLEMERVCGRPADPVQRHVGSVARRCVRGGTDRRARRLDSPHRRPRVANRRRRDAGCFRVFVQ